MKFAVTTLVSFLAWFSTQGFACSCAPTPSIEDAFQEATVVHTGKVTSIAKDGFTAVVTFGPSKGYKAFSKFSQFKVRTNTSSAACGYSFKVDEEYLVYGHVNADGVIMTNLCTRTKKSAGAAKEIEVLEKLATP